MSPGARRLGSTRRLACAATLALSAVGGAVRGEDAAPARADLDFELPCGLEVHLRPNAKSTRVAVVTCYGVGDQNDLTGYCGMAHLCEHMIATAGIGSRGPRTVQALAAAYPDGWNAQTGRRTTILGFVVPPERLGSEIDEAAGRMMRLVPTQADLDRERPRILAELRGMYDGAAPLAAVDRARARRCGLCACPRPGGDSSYLERATLDELVRFLPAYGPTGAHLSIAGRFDVEDARRLVTAAFASAVEGDVAMHVPRGGILGFGGGYPRWETVRLREAKPHIGLSGSAGWVDGEGVEKLAASLVRMARVLERAGEIGPLGTFPPGVSWAPLDGAPDVAFAVPLRDGEDADAGFARVRGVLAKALAGEVTADDVSRAERTFGLLFSLVDDPPGAAENPYGVALSAARLAQLGVDVRALRAALRQVKRVDLPEILEDHPFSSGGIWILPAK